VGWEFEKVLEVCMKTVLIIYALATWSTDSEMYEYEMPDMNKCMQVLEVTKAADNVVVTCGQVKKVIPRS